MVAGWDERPFVEARSLGYTAPPDPSDPTPGRQILRDLSFSLPRGARALVVGANGAGKSTLLRVLAGKTMAQPRGSALVGCRDPFVAETTARGRGSEGEGGAANGRGGASPRPARSVLCTPWASWGVREVAFAGTGVALGAESVSVAQALARAVGVDPSSLLRGPEGGGGGLSAGALPSPPHPVRRLRRLLAALDLDPRTPLSAGSSSDGTRQKVALALSLAEPAALYLLDEATADLDVLARSELLSFLREESDNEGAVIIYATHIFDGLEEGGAGAGAGAGEGEEPRDGRSRAEGSGDAEGSAGRESGREEGRGGGGCWASHVLWLRGGTVAEFTAVEDDPELSRGLVLPWVVRRLAAEAAERATPPGEEGSGERGSTSPWSFAWNNGFSSGRMTSTVRD